MDERNTLPSSFEAEVTLLSNMIKDGEVIDLALEIIKDEEAFYYPANKIVFNAIKSLHSRGRHVNMISLTDELKTTAKLDDVGGPKYIIDICDGYLSSANTKDMAKIVWDKYLFRKLYRAAETIRTNAMSANGDIKRVISEAEDKILDIGLGTDLGKFESMQYVLKDAADEINRRAKLNGELPGISSGFPDIDAMLNGFQKSDFILLAARPSMGKTAIAINFAVNAALEGRSVAIFSLEMSKVSLAMRIFSQLTNISLSKILTGDMDKESWIRLGHAMNQNLSSMYIDDTANLSVSDLRSRLRRLKLENGLDLVVIDYLQLMEGSARSENRQQEVSKISRGLKSIAKELDVPIITLSQLSRGPEARSDKRPGLADIRDSGAIEQDADVVMFLYRDEYYNKDTEDKGIAELIVAKHRNGSTGTIKLSYHSELTKFKSLSRRQDEF